ncbi:MAG: nitroreductase family protein [Fervidicoccus fontis]|jgi:nitroreductase|uniref:Nitroreductase family protein n=2 Tax=Fervidicoccus fontis TaxID=683846 RepID=A0A7C2ZA38_9CREN|nr:MAG: nitroreductase family protein [Fervidicoccus fontis]HEW63529.1 nitroreductase family protein [Fervidicoccus fontis]
MEELMNIIKGRRATRIYENREIPREDVKKILEAGIWAPSGSNLQSWEFVVILKNELIEKIKMISPGLFGNPAMLIIGCINTERAKKGGKIGYPMAMMDVSMAFQNMMLMAYSLGIGSCPILSFNKDALRELLDIPEHIDPILMVTFGYPSFWPNPPKRRSMEEVMHLDKFGRPFEE